MREMHGYPLCNPSYSVGCAQFNGCQAFLSRIFVPWFLLASRVADNKELSTRPDKICQILSR